MGRTLLSDLPGIITILMFIHHRQLKRDWNTKSKSTSKASDKSVRSTRAHPCPYEFLWNECMTTGMLPHYQKAGRALFVTFRKLIPTPFPADAKDAILRHCLHDDGKRYLLHAAVIMPEHVHLLLTPSSGQRRLALRPAGNFEVDQGRISEKRERATGFQRPRLARGILRPRASFATEPGRKARVHSSDPAAKRLGKEAGRLPLALGRARPEMRQVPCGSDTLVRRL